MQRVSTSTSGIAGPQRFQMSFFALCSILVVAMVPTGCSTTDLPADTGATSDTNDSGSETSNPTSDSSVSSSENSSNPTTTSGTGTTTESTTGSTTESSDDGSTSESAGTTAETTTEGTTESSDDGSTGTSDSEDSGDTSDSNSGSGSEDGDPLKELGEPCDSGKECLSGICFQGGTFSTCSECTNDETCQMEGKGINCILHYEEITSKYWRVCSNGALGESCQSDEGCESKICTTQINGIPLSEGTCGLCRDNEECRADGKGNNCTFHPWDEPRLYYHKCTEGPRGAMCQKDIDCADGPLVCAENDSQPSPRGSTCSQCNGHQDCRTREDGQPKDLCHFHIEFKNDFGTETAIGSHFDCVSEGSVATGEYCSITKDGDEACDGFCTPVFSTETIGICSPCRPDAPADCPQNQMCTPPKITSSGPVAAKCE